MLKVVKNNKKKKKRKWKNLIFFRCWKKFFDVWCTTILKSSFFSKYFHSFFHTKNHFCLIATEAATGGPPAPVEPDPVGGADETEFKLLLELLVVTSWEVTAEEAATSVLTDTEEVPLLTFLLVFSLLLLDFLLPPPELFEFEAGLFRELEERLDSMLISPLLPLEVVGGEIEETEEGMTGGVAVVELLAGVDDPVEDMSWPLMRSWSRWWRLWWGWLWWSSWWWLARPRDPPRSKRWPPRRLPSPRPR